MAENDWKWADLDGSQVNLLKEGEDTLGADILLAYKQSLPANVQVGMVSHNRLKVAPLSDNQLECLQGLENKLQAVVIAYRKG